MNKHKCGTCNHFGFQDVYGAGVCTLKEHPTFCFSLACNEFEPKKINHFDKEFESFLLTEEENERLPQGAF